MQPKMGGKLLLKLNTGTRPIANKYREGKMKSTLKRKLRVRETVSREAHGISSARWRFRTVRVSLAAVVDPIGLRRCHSMLVFSHFSNAVRQRVFGLVYTSRGKVAGFAACVIGFGD